VIAARRIATARPGGRLDPPLRLVLDELPNICPLPRVVEYISEGGGRGIEIVWYAQSRYQLVRRFGPDGAKVLLDATSAMLYAGASKTPSCSAISPACSASSTCVTTAGGGPLRAGELDRAGP